MKYDLEHLRYLLNTAQTTEPDGALRYSTGDLLNLAGLVAIADQLEAVSKSLSSIDVSLGRIANRD